MLDPGFWMLEEARTRNTEPRIEQGKVFSEGAFQTLTAIFYCKTSQNVYKNILYPDKIAAAILSADPR
jgi:hypothetical protein